MLMIWRLACGPRVKRENGIEIEMPCCRMKFANFILQQGISISMPFSRFTLGPQASRQIISISGGAVPAIYFQDQKVTMEQLEPLLDAAKRKDQSIIIKADRSTSYETVAEVANAALEHGITSVALAASPPR